MFFRRYNEFRILTYLTFIQVLAVFFGWGLLTLGVKIGLEAGFDVKPNAIFLRDWGLLFFLIPCAWLAFAIFIKRSTSSRYDNHIVFWSGLAVALIIFYVMSVIGANAGTSLVETTETL